MDIKYILKIVIYILFALAILIALFGVLLTVLDFIKSELKPKSYIDVVKKNTILKNKLASYILLSLEILVAGDIINSTVRPTFDDLITLVTLVFIRTLISYFLNREINSSEP